MLLRSIGFAIKPVVLAVLTLLGTQVFSQPKADEKNNPVRPTQTTPVAQSTSASATADKGGGQVVSTDFGKLSFAEIQKHPNRADILKKLDGNTYDKFDEWIETGKKAVIKEGKKIDEETLAVIKEGVDLDKQLIQSYEKYITNIESGAAGERSMVEKIANATITPKLLQERAQKLLKSNNTRLASL